MARSSSSTRRVSNDSPMTATLGAPPQCRNFQAMAVGCFVTQSPPYQAMGRTSTSKSRIRASVLRSSRIVAPEHVVQVGPELLELPTCQRLVELVERVGQDGVDLFVSRQ